MSRHLSGIRWRLPGYSGARPDVVRLIEGAPKSVLDVGCGAGLTASLIRRRFPSAWLVGIEPDPTNADRARNQFDEVLCSRVEELDALEGSITSRSFDVIVLADVLEHIVDPERVLRQMVGRLSPGGKIITSIPNVRHWSTFWALGVGGRWPRRLRGIHDRTHVRFFTRADVLEMAHSAGLRLDQEHRNLRLFESQPWSKIPAKLTDFWPLRPFTTFQYLHRWRV